MPLNYSLLFPPTNTRMYATWDPGDLPSAAYLSNMNLTGNDASGLGVLISTIGKSSGKWYCEVIINSAPNPAVAGRPAVGIVSSDFSQTTAFGFTQYGYCLTSVFGYMESFTVNNNTYTAVYSDYMYAGDVIGVALDMDSRKISWYINGTLVSLDNPIPTAMTGSMFIGAFELSGITPAVFTANFTGPFVSTVPSGYNSGLY